MWHTKHNQVGGLFLWNTCYRKSTGFPKYLENHSLDISKHMTFNLSYDKIPTNFFKCIKQMSQEKSNLTVCQELDCIV